MQKIPRQGATSQQDKSQSNSEDQKDPGNLLKVFQIYRNQEQLRNSGILNGGLDIGMDPMQLSVDFNQKE